MNHEIIFFTLNRLIVMVKGMNFWVILIVVFLGACSQDMVMNVPNQNMASNPIDKDIKYLPTDLPLDSIVRPFCYTIKAK